jgi:hypothetical protein
MNQMVENEHVEQNPDTELTPNVIKALAAPKIRRRKMTDQKHASKCRATTTGSN